MNSKTAIKIMLSATNKSKADIAKAIGKSDSYVNMAMQRDIRISTLLDIANAAGYELKLQSGDNTILITK